MLVRLRFYRLVTVSDRTGQLIEFEDFNQWDYIWSSKNVPDYVYIMCHCVSLCACVRVCVCMYVVPAVVNDLSCVCLRAVFTNVTGFIR